MNMDTKNQVHNAVKTASRDRKMLVTFGTYFVFFLPRFTEYKADAYVQYHMKQAIGLLITALSLQGVISILGYWGMPSFMGVWPVRFVLFYLLFVGLRNAYGKQAQPLPWIGRYADRLFP